MIVHEKPRAWLYSTGLAAKYVVGIRISMNTLDAGLTSQYNTSGTICDCMRILPMPLSTDRNIPMIAYH